MTLLANRARTTASDNDATRQNGRQDERAATGRKISLSPGPSAAGAGPLVAVPDDVLRTLRARLQTQLNNSDGRAASDTDPEARFLVESIRRRLDQVNTALARIDEGKYGVCADCQEPIENDRLVLQPMSTRCTRCQAIAEWRGTTY